ncbi:hypothetical protein EVAR_24204_1 [Eumeta japonica]|uniref:Uncharacterized protein n=1 Tax=Eumeta variegata TaxID=151549 RepID=A0A4C1W4M8_EUMVA|nr:hypothetical protein EVAR_24204_1 [Eumeta japonica]
MFSSKGLKQFLIIKYLIHVCRVRFMSPHHYDVSSHRLFISDEGLFGPQLFARLPATCISMHTQPTADPRICLDSRVSGGLQAAR